MSVKNVCKSHVKIFSIVRETITSKNTKISGKYHTFSAAVDTNRI